MFKNLKLQHLPGRETRLAGKEGSLVYWTRSPVAGPPVAYIAACSSLIEKAGMGRVIFEHGVHTYYGPDKDDHGNYWTLEHDSERKLWRVAWSKTWRGAYKVRVYSRTFLRIEVVIRPEYPLPESSSDLILKTAQL